MPRSRRALAFALACALAPSGHALARPARTADLAHDDGAQGPPVGKPTPLSLEQMGRLLARSHRDAFGVSPGPERLLVAWAHAAMEIGKGSRCIENNFGNIVVSRSWKGASHLRRVEEREASDTAPEGSWRVADVLFRTHETPYDGAYDYWQVITYSFGSTLPSFDEGDAEAAGKGLCERGYSTASCDAYGASLAAAYRDLRSRFAHRLRDVLAYDRTPPMSYADWAALERDHGITGCFSASLAPAPPETDMPTPR